MTPSGGDKSMTATDAPKDPETLSVNVSRFIGAPRQRVFEVWVKPELRRKWWRTHRGEGLTVCEIDLRVGGRYCMKQIGGGCESPGDDPNYEWIMEGEFLEVDPYRKLVFTWNVNHPAEPASDERVTIEFNEADGGTEVIITHRGILSTHLRDGTEKGWTTLLETQAGVLERD